MLRRLTFAPVLACCLALPALSFAASSDPGSGPSYFRSDLGSPAQTGPLPGDLNAPNALVWRTALDGGHSSPISVQGKLFLTTYRAEDQELATVAFDQKTGQLLWKKPITPSTIEKVHPQTGNPATPSPASDGDRLFVFFGSYGLIAYDLNGAVLWEKRMGPFQDEFGAGSSPIVVDNKLILQQDHDIDSFLMALDVKNGATLWTQPRPAAVRSYSTPAVWKSANQLLVAGALELSGHDLSTGEKLWWINGLARIVIPVPVPDSQTVYMASWSPGAETGARISLDRWSQALEKWDANKNGQLTRTEINDKDVLDRFFRMDLDQNSSLNEAEWDRHADVFRLAQNSILALQPTGRGDLTRSSIRWKFARGIPYVATPLVHNGIVWMVKDGGIVTKLDATTGARLQEERLPQLGNYFASPVSGDGKVYFASQSGGVSIVADGRDWQVISSRKFDENIFATPLIVRDQLIIRTGKALHCFKGTVLSN